MNTKAGTFRSDIEGLRAVAVLLVIAYHAHLFLCVGGFIGVDVFFVLSGYLITQLLLREVDQTGSIALGPFYARRVRRLLPACTLMVLTVAIISFFVLPPLEQARLSRSALATSAYLGNVYFYYMRSDYFAVGVSDTPLLHTWSLGVEEQFYFVWPLLLLGIARLTHRQEPRRLLLGLVGVSSFILSICLIRSDQPAAFFLTPPRAWEFAVGALASQVPKNWRPLRPSLMPILGWFGLCAIAIPAFAISVVGFPGWKVATAVFGTAAVLIAGAAQAAPQGAGKLLSSSPLLYLGKRSYALYLWHWPMLILWSVPLGALSLPLKTLCLLVSLLAADLSYRFVESPIRLNLYLQTRTALCLAAASLVMISGIASSLAWRYWAVHTPSYRRFSSSIADLPADVAQGCLNEIGNSTPHPCFFGSISPLKTVILMGDSHMEQWLPAFQQIASARNWKIILYAKSSCPALAIVAVPYAEGEEDRSCVLWRQQTILEIRAQHPDAVILSNASWYPEITRRTVQQSPEEWKIGARKTFLALHQSGVPIVFLRDTPPPGYEVVLCLSRADWNRFVSCPTPVRSTALNDAMYLGQQEGARGISDISFVDMSDSICDGQWCPLTHGDLVIYRDVSHITATFARSLSANLDRQLTRAVPALGT